MIELIALVATTTIRYLPYIAIAEGALIAAFGG